MGRLEDAWHNYWERVNDRLPPNLQTPGKGLHWVRTTSGWQCRPHPKVILGVSNTGEWAAFVNGQELYSSTAHTVDAAAEAAEMVFEWLMAPETEGDPARVDQIVTKGATQEAQRAPAHHSSSVAAGENLRRHEPDPEETATLVAGLRQLAELHRRGDLSSDEFKQAKKQLLGRDQRPPGDL